VSFKPGQKVLCIDNGGFEYLKEGEIYTVLIMNSVDKIDDYVYLCELTKTGPYYTKRFVDAESYLHNKKFKTKIDDIIKE
jgi:hypothetical protein